MDTLDPAAFAALLNDRFAQAAIPADADALGRLLTHAQMLEDWSARMNLVGLKDRARWVDELYLDSALLLSAVDAAEGTMIDLGSGAGFPGLVLAALRPRREVLLVDSNGKKTAFLSAAIEAMKLPAANVAQVRLEEFARGGRRGRCGAAVFKALGKWSVGLELATPLVRIGGRVVFLQGKDPPAAGVLQGVVDRPGGGTAEICPYRLPGADHDRHIVTVVKAGATPAEYPRKVGIPERKPLDELSSARRG